MNDRDDLPLLSGDERELLSAYAEQHAMPDEARERVWDRLIVPFPAGPGGGSGGGAAGPGAVTASATASAAGSAAGTGWIIAASVAAVAAVGTAFWRPWAEPPAPVPAQVHGREAPQPRSAEPAPQPVAASPHVAAPAVPEVAPPAPLGDPILPSTPARPSTSGAPVPAAPPPPSDLGAELERMEEARDALRDGDDERAKREARAYLDAFPEGSFVPEARAIEVLALCRSNDPRAEREAEAVLRRGNPPKRLRTKIEQECQAGDGTAGG